MENQNYKNHIRYYPPHHFVFYPLVVFLLCVALNFVFKTEENQAIWLVLVGVLFLLGYLSFMVRQHYALTNQNRIVRLELRLRYFILTQKRFEDIESRLSASQLFALRFAPDAELPLLVERALKEQLTGDAIKRAIKNWLPDTQRV